MISNTFVLARALAWSSCRSSGRAGLAIRNASSQATAARCRAAKPERPRDRVGSLMAALLEGNVLGQRPEFDMRDQRLRVLQDGVLASLRANLEGIDHALVFPLLFVVPRRRAPSHLARMHHTNLVVGVERVAGEQTRDTVAMARQLKEDRPEGVARELGTRHERDRVVQLNGRPPDTGVRRVERAVDRPLVGGDPRLG